MPEKGVDPRHKILRRPQIFHEARTRCYQVAANPFSYQVGIHASCVCNELISLTNRHLVDRTSVKFDKRLWQEISLETTRKYYTEQLQPCTYEAVVAGYTGSKKRAYHDAMVKNRMYGIPPKHPVQMFIKADKYPVADLDTKAPRAIQYRGPRFNIAFGVYIKAFEDWLYPSVHYGVVSRTRVIAKGLNNYERAELWLEKVSHFRQPRFLCVDHSTFDATINEHHLRTTHRKYLKAFRSKTLAKLCKAQIVNKGYTRSGIKYMARGTRMSGDPDTACGNSIVNADCLYGFLTRSGISKYDLMLDGDDSIIVVEAHDVPKLDYMLFERMGFTTKHELFEELHEVEFCQAKLILAQRPVFARNPARALSRAGVARHSYAPQIWARWLAGVGLCEQAQSQGVPVLQAFGTKLASLSNRPFFDAETRYVRETYQIGRHAIPVTADARDTFALAWGVPWDIQQVLEEYDYTANSFPNIPRKSELGRYGRKWVASIARRVWSLSQSTPECSGGSWWGSC